MEQIIEPVDKKLLIAELTKDKFLRHTNKGKNEIYVTDAHTSPNVMKEIGRLREWAFRSAGGGTGLACDIDEFDTMPRPCRQLIVWNPEEQEIVGGYRFIFGEDIEVDAEVAQVFLDLGKLAVDAIAGEESEILVRTGEEAVAFLVLDFLSDGDEVFAVVIVVPEFEGIAEEFLVAGIEGEAKMAHLVPAVVHVILAGDVAAGLLEKRGRGIAEGCAPGMAEVEVAGRVGRNELDVDLPILLRPVAEAGPFLEDLAHDRFEVFLLEEEVDEARAGDFTVFDEVGREAGGDVIG